MITAFAKPTHVSSPAQYFTVSTAILLHLFWLAGIWWTNASDHSFRLLLLALWALIAGIAVASISSDRLNAFTDWVLNNDKTCMLIAVISLIFLGLFYANYQRVWTWDEENNLKAARILAEDGVAAFFRQYADIPWLGNQHPPLVPLINGFVMRMIGTQLYVIRMVSVGFGLGTLLTTYFLGRHLYDRRVGFLAAILLPSFPLIFRLSTAALLDIQVTFFFSLSILMTLRLFRQPSYGWAFGLGVIIGAGLLTKYTMVFIFPVLFGVLLVDGRFKDLFPYLMVVCLVSGLLLGAWLLYANHLDILRGHQRTVRISQRIQHAGWIIRTTGGQKLLGDIFFKRLSSAIGLYNFPLIICGVVLLLRRRQQQDQFILLYIGIIILLLVLTFPDHRYFLPTFPAIAIMMATWLRSMPELAARFILLNLSYAASLMWLFIDWRGLSLPLFG